MVEEVNKRRESLWAMKISVDSFIQLTSEMSKVKKNHKSEFILEKFNDFSYIHLMARRLNSSNM